MSTPLIVVSSRTGNTQKIADALHGAIPSAKMVRAEELPEDLSDFNPVFLGFWCDRGMAPEDMKAEDARKCIETFFKAGLIEA